MEKHSRQILAPISAQRDLTLDEIVSALHRRRIPGSRSALSRLLRPSWPEQTGKVCRLEGVAKRQQLLSPDQYEIVDVRTSGGVKQAILIPKAVLKAVWEAEAPFREVLGIKGERKRLRAKRPAK